MSVAPASSSLLASTPCSSSAAARSRWAERARQLAAARGAARGRRRARAARRAAPRDPAALPVQHAQLDRGADPHPRQRPGAGDAPRPERADARAPSIDRRRTSRRSPLELEFTKRYVELQQVRFGDRLEVGYAIDAACEACRVPTFLLQPIVENAFRHGHRRQGRAVPARDRRGDRRPAAPAPSVRDDGAGLPRGVQPRPDAGTGLSNIRTRLAEPLRSARHDDDRRRARRRHARHRRRCRRRRPRTSRGRRHDRLPRARRRRRAARPRHGRRDRPSRPGRRRGVECGDARLVPRLVAEHRPHILFLDIEMPETSRDPPRRAGGRRRPRDRVRHRVQPVRDARLRRAGDRLRAEAVLGRAAARGARAREAARARAAPGRAGRTSCRRCRPTCGIASASTEARVPGATTCSGWRSRSATGRWC